MIKLLSKSVLVLGTALTLTACGGSSSSSEPEAKAPETGSDLKTLDSLVRTFSIQNEECPNGGIEIEMGIDSNGNARLDPNEVDHNRTQTICHGADGSDGENAEGSLISITSATVDECTDGGKKILIGLDSNSNHILETAEVQKTELICNAVVNTASSISSLVSTSAEAIGENCSGGGVRIDTGLDINDDQVLAAEEVQATSYVCSGQDGANGSGSVDLENLLIETVNEPFGANCLHGGNKNQIGVDINLDGELQIDEITSTSYSCHPNAAPEIVFNAHDKAIPNVAYTLVINSYDYDFYNYTSDRVGISIIEKPSWLAITSTEEYSTTLSGIPVGSIGDSFTIKARSTDGDLTTDKEFIVTIVDGIQVSMSAVDVVEGNLGELGQPHETPAEFIVSLSKPLTNTLQVHYQLEGTVSTVGKDWVADQTNGVISFSAGEVEKKILLTVLGDNQFEIEDSLSLILSNIDYAGDDLILLQSQQSLTITNDDSTQIELRADQENFVAIMDNQYYGFGEVEFTNQPEWMGYSQQYEYNCDQLGCYEQKILGITGNPPLNTIDESASFEIGMQVAGKRITQTLTYLVTEGDIDNDGVLNSADTFPENPRGQTDSDEDGLGDEWEMANFDSLELADVSSDFDENGITDKSAFENGTAINDISFDFESGELPVGWMNTGNVNWIVSDTLSYDGQYALTLEHALAPNETARIEFDISAQQGELKLYARAAEQLNNTDLRIEIDSNNSLWMHVDASYWYSNSGHLNAGQHKLALTYHNYSSTHNAPVIYIDNISGLAGMIPADRDGDGVLNNVDLYPDRSDAATDTDGDGIADEWEQRYFGTLDRATAISDFDNDGLLDLNEFIQATNPSNNDSDGDGILDAEDAFPSDSQYQADTDNDGLADKWELAHFASLEISDGSQDSDGDSATDLAEFIAGTPPTPDRDGDGVADVVDAFPDNAAYKTDADNDGLADEWEYQYSYPGDFSADDDFDQDGRTDLEEFLAGTSPVMKNLNAVEDILAVVQGQIITFNPAENDIATQGNQSGITTASISLPVGEPAKFGSLQDNSDGTFSYTAANDRLGWLRLSYEVSDGESKARGEIFIHIVEQAPAQVMKIDSAVTGYDSHHSMALFNDGSLYAWGENSQGQLGLGTTTNNYVPTQVGGLPKITDFSLGRAFSLALDVDGTVWSWGNGVATPEPLIMSFSDVPQDPLADIKEIAATGGCCSLSYYLLKEDGSVHSGSLLQIGGLTPIDGLNNIEQIKAGSNHLLALDESGIVWAIGSNNSGQLGYGQDTDSVTSPVQVSKITNIKSIEAANNQSFAIDEDGQLFAWGNSWSGMLGDSTFSNRNVPVLVESLTDVVEVVAGYNHTLVRTGAGDLYGMGYGYPGALGDEGKQQGNVITPIKITEEKVSSIGAGNNSSFFITEDNRSYSLGTNTNGQLGDGTTQDHSTPAEISWLLDGVVSELGKEGFEWGRIPPYWRNSGNNWQVVDNTVAGDVSTGSFAAKVKERLTDNAAASLGLQIATGAGDVSFNVKTSTEAEYDKLVFYIDGAEQAVFSGDNDWVSSASFSVTAGVHSFEWIYHKDGGTSAGEDTVWIDDILLPIDSDGDGIIDRQDPSPYVPDAVPAPIPEPILES